MSRISIGSISLIVLFALSVTSAGQSIVNGTVYDRNDAVLPGFVIRASNKKKIIETKSDNAGKYFLSLPAGVYALSACWPESGYWYPLRRSNLLIEADGNYEVDLWPTRRILSTSLVITKRGVSEPASLAPMPQYEEYSFSKRTKVKLMMQFSNSNQQESKFQNVVLTYDQYTIRADVAEVDSLKREIVLTGAVRFSGHVKKIVSRNATLLLERKGPVLTIEGKSYDLTSGASNDHR